MNALSQSGHEEFIPQWHPFACPMPMVLRVGKQLKKAYGACPDMHAGKEMPRAGSKTASAILHWQQVSRENCPSVRGY